MLTDRDELIYLAGFIDGEGSISTDRGVLRLSAGQIDPTPLEMLRSRFGGHLRLISKSASNPRHRDLHLWTVAAKSAGIALEALLPFLVVKRRQALVGIELQSRKLHQGGNKGLLPEERQARQILVENLRLLNRAPYQTIDMVEYDAAVKKLKPIHLGDDTHEVTDAYCEGDRCELPHMRQA